MTWLHFGHSLLGLLIHFCLLGSEDSGAFFCGKSLAINYPNCPVENTERKNEAGLLQNTNSNVRISVIC
jgi:hypothetical protein